MTRNVNCLISIILLMAVDFSFAGQKVRLEREFIIKPGQQVEIEGRRMKIKFESVTDDSRCPQGVDCIWAGNAEVNLRLTLSASETVTIKLNTNLDPREAEHRGYRVKLARLDPYPKKDVKIEPGEYRATLIVTNK
jgi:hypothetical protein